MTSFELQNVYHLILDFKKDLKKQKLKALSQTELDFLAQSRYIEQYTLIRQSILYGRFMSIKPK